MSVCTSYWSLLGRTLDANKMSKNVTPTNVNSQWPWQGQFDQMMMMMIIIIIIALGYNFFFKSEYPGTILT